MKLVPIFHWDNKTKRSMKLSLRMMMMLCLTLMLNTLSYGASYSTAIGEPDQKATVKKENLRTKAKQFVQKRIIKKAKNHFKDATELWSTLKEQNGKKKAGLITLVLLLATVTLVVLQLLEVIAWSWLWILAPLWIPIAFFILVFIIALIYFLIKGKK